MQITPGELTFLDAYFTHERQRLGQELAREREQNGERTLRVGTLSDGLRRIDNLHARVKASMGRGPVEIDPGHESASGLNELRALHRTLL